MKAKPSPPRKVTPVPKSDQPCRPLTPPKASPVSKAAASSRRPVSPPKASPVPKAATSSRSVIPPKATILPKPEQSQPLRPRDCILLDSVVVITRESSSGSGVELQQGIPFVRQRRLTSSNGCAVSILTLQQVNEQERSLHSIGAKC